MPVNTRNGWTAATISHDAGLHDLSLKSRNPLIGAAPTQAPSAIGPVNGWAQNPISAADLMTDPSAAKDSSLASRKYMNPGTGAREAAASASVYQQADAPAFLQQAISNLNSEQAMKRAQQSELVNRILMGVNSGGPNDYLWAEALRAASVGAGAHVNFSSAVQDPRVGIGYENAANAYADKTAEQTKSLTAANTAINGIPEMEKQRARLGSVVMGGYEGSPQQQLDRQLTQSHLAASPVSSTQLLGRSANASGWFPTFNF